MVVKIRLSRFGKRHQPLYNIVVAQARTARDSRPLEVLGTYDPTPKYPLASNDPPPTSLLSATSSDATSSPPSTDTTSNSSVSPSQAPKVKRYKDISLDLSRTKYWLGVGAQPSEPVWRLLAMMGLMDSRPGTKRASEGQKIGETS